MQQSRTLTGAARNLQHKLNFILTAATSTRPDSCGSDYSILNAENYIDVLFHKQYAPRSIATNYPTNEKYIELLINDRDCQAINMGLLINASLTLIIQNACVNVTT